MRKVECFKTKLYISTDLFDKSKWIELKEFINSHFSLKEPTVMIADPFLFVENDTLFLFYEMKKLYHDGVICMMSTTDLKNWSKPIVVLEECCHLSYPWIFRHNSNIYMVPETQKLKEVRVYKASKDLKKFSYVKTLCIDKDNNDISFCDSSILTIDNIHYLFTSTYDKGLYKQRLFYSSDVLSDYKECKCSPICVSNKYGRNGGNLFDYNGHIYRVTQDCTNGYGNGVHVLEVDKCSKDYYHEITEHDFFLPTTYFYKYGGHQFSWVEFRGKFIIATDAKDYRYYLVNKVLRRIGLYK